MSQTATELKTTHTTPQKHYVDDQIMGFKPGSNGGCVVSVSEINDTFFFNFGARTIDINFGLSVSLLNKRIKRFSLSLSFTQGFSTSETWYAVLDDGTNYCNLYNLVDGSSLRLSPGFKETTDDSSCTQYSSHNCTVY